MNTKLVATRWINRVCHTKVLLPCEIRSKKMIQESIQESFANCGKLTDQLSIFYF